MKTNRFFLCLVFSLLLATFATSCSDDGVDNREQEYGYAQFKIYKKASYDSSQAQSASRAAQSILDYLSDASKINVTLSFEGTTISQTLNLSAADATAAEYGLRSDKLKLVIGNYDLLSFTLYDKFDEVLYNSTSEDLSSFSVISGGLTVQDLTVNVTPRGRVQFTFKKDMSEFESASSTRSKTRVYTFDEISYVNLNVARVLASGNIASRTKLEMLPVDFSLELDENNEANGTPGYQTSLLRCDSLILLPAGNYRLLSYETFDSEKSLLETESSPKALEFTIEDNALTKADVAIKLHESDEYIKDYYALYEIWKSLDGENWSYDGQDFTLGVNWDFNKDVDLWGDQPGVQLHSNGRVARIDISEFGFRGHLSPAIGQLTQLIELYLGTHNDTSSTNYDPSLSLNLSAAERSARRMELNKEYLSIIHPATQFTEPIARALAEKNIKIPATSLYETMKESDIIDMKSGAQKIKPMDQHYGTLRNGLKSLPKEIGKLKNLQYLYIANGELESLPEEVADLTACTDIEIYNCPKLKKFPMAITRMPELVSINISANLQWAAVDFYAGMKALANGPSREKLQIIYARQNNLPEMPADFANFKKLGLLDLSYNKISKLNALGEDVSFDQLYLDNNMIESFPVDEYGYFCGYDDMENFSVKNNRLKKVPNIFSSKSKYIMKSVDFTGNDITGCEGEENGTYNGINVETLTLALNPNMKKYPLGFAKTNSFIAYIILRACNIEEIPEGAFTYKNSVDLVSLDLSYNKLTDLPREMHAGNMPYLYGVELSFNCFSEFPYEPLDASGLTVFAIRSQRDENGNRCLKEWPTGIYQHTGLRGLYIGSNDLRKIEDTISTLIYYLDISDNPNIIFDASDICYAWRTGAYILIYDKTQNILNCDYMLE